MKCFEIFFIGHFNSLSLTTGESPETSKSEIYPILTTLIWYLVRSWFVCGNKIVNVPTEYALRIYLNNTSFSNITLSCFYRFPWIKAVSSLWFMLQSDLKFASEAIPNVLQVLKLPESCYFYILRATYCSWLNFSHGLLVKTRIWLTANSSPVFILNNCNVF